MNVLGNDKTFQYAGTSIYLAIAALLFACLFARQHACRASRRHAHRPTC